MSVQIDTKKLSRDIKALGKTTSKAAADATKVALQQAQAFYMSFDETESVPFVKDSNGMITVSGPGLSRDSQASIEDVLAKQTWIAAETAQQFIQRKLREVLGD